MAAIAVEDYLARARREESALSRSFWYGKYLQALNSCERGAGAEATKYLSVTQTSLSPCVYQLLLEPMPLQGSEPALLCSDGTLDLNVLRIHLEKDISTVDLHAMAANCASISKQVHCELERGILPQLCVAGHFQWSRSSQVFLTCLKDIKAGNTLSALLIGSAALEAALGDVYLSVSRAQHTPFLMRDLLKTSELKSTFGVTMMCLLQCLVGPPSGLNLRNLVWHGFVAPSEVVVEYGYIFFAVVATLGRLLQSSSLAIIHQSYVSWPQLNALESVFDVVQNSELPVVAELFTSSYLVLPSMLPTWHSAIAALQERRLDCFMVLMLSALEHSLRRVYACVNMCPERVITAESTMLYTTFEEILSPVLPGGGVNCLKDELQPAYLELLLDMLQHPEGPRLRDRFSHGQANFEEIPETLANHVLCVAIVLTAHYSLDKQILQRSPVTGCVAIGQDYVSLFHPLSLLKTDLLELLTLAENLHTEDPHSTFNAATSHVLSLLPLSVLPCTLGQLQLAVYGFSSEQRIVELVRQVWQQVDTLYTGRMEMELTLLLRSTVCWLTRSAVQIKVTMTLRRGQLEQKELRSRQRTNFQHLLASVNMYRHMLFLLVVFVITLIHNVKKSNKTYIKFTKKVLQFSENFYSQTLPTKNRWEETNKLCNGIAEMLCLFRY